MIIRELENGDVSITLEHSRVSKCLIVPDKCVGQFAKILERRIFPSEEVGKQEDK